MPIGFRRICTGCKKPVGWAQLDPNDEDGYFFHLDDHSSLCQGCTVDLEIKEFQEEKHA